MNQSSNQKAAKELIQTLSENKFYCECPCGCGEILLKDAGLFYLDDFTDEAYERYKEMKAELQNRKKNMKARPERGAKAVNIGFELEHITPTLKNFPFERNDCRFISEPIDYVIFEGLYKKGIVTKIIFSDVKTGSARLQQKQKTIKTLVENKKVEFKPY